MLTYINILRVPLSSTNLGTRVWRCETNNPTGDGSYQSPIAGSVIHLSSSRTTTSIDLTWLPEWVDSSWSHYPMVSKWGSTWRSRYIFWMLGRRTSWILSTSTSWSPIRVFCMFKFSSMMNARFEITFLCMNSWLHNDIDSNTLRCFLSKLRVLL